MALATPISPIVVDGDGETLFPTIPRSVTCAPRRAWTSFWLNDISRPQYLPFCYYDIVRDYTADMKTIQALKIIAKDCEEIILGYVWQLYVTDNVIAVKTMSRRLQVLEEIDFYISIAPCLCGCQQRTDLYDVIRMNPDAYNTDSAVTELSNWIHLEQEDRLSAASFDESTLMD